LIRLPEFADKYLEKMHQDYFSPSVGRVIKGMKRVYMAHKTCPSLKQLIDTIIPKVCKDNEEEAEESIDSLQEAEYCDLPTSTEGFYDWLQEETQEFIKRSRLEMALVKCVELMEQNKNDEAVNEILKANEISFDDSLGIDYFEDLEKRMEELRNPGVVINTGMPKLNTAIGGGWRPKSLNIFGAATNVGKTLILGHIAYNLIEQGYNGIYLTLEINEHLLANRIDANMSDIGMSELSNDVDVLMERIIRKKKERDQLAEENPDDYKPFGRLIVKEYPPSTINSNQLLSFVRELELRRKRFKPDFIVVDYLGLMAPNGKTFSDNTYGKLKTVSEELRAIGVMLGVPIFTAVQVNRDGYNTSYVGVDKTADSIGIPQTADLMIMVCRDEEADDSNIMYWSIAKSRFSKNGANFTMQVDYNHMRIVDDSDRDNSDDAYQAALDAARSFRDRKNKKSSDNAEDE